MPDRNSKPVVLLIYANTGPVLDCLKPETDTIASHLEASGLCDIRIVAAATLLDVVTAINDPKLQDRVTIVHYAGHANGQGIQLQSQDATTLGETAYIRGLAEVLTQQSHLRLLFINGCASREQVLELTQAGIPLVIATNQGIDDKAARDFAECFYRTLGQQRSIAASFQVAAGMLKSAAGKNVRSLYFDEFQTSATAKNSEWPWELHGPDADRHWSLADPYYRGTGPRWDHTKHTFNPDSPYLGLRYFAEQESSRFFGRDDFVQTLLTASEAAPLLLVIGASGTGKSSVVRAGMIPHWKRKHRGGSPGRAFIFTPQDDPFEQLSTALAAVDTFDRPEIRKIREAPSRTALRDAVKTFGQGESWLFFIDQFEQIFTRTTDQKKRADFLDAMTDLAKSEHPNICLVLAMRDDFFPQLRDYPELFPLTDKHCFRVASLGRSALQEVIERPAAEHGVTFQPGLVGDIIEAVDRQPGMLPLLQYALHALWKADDLSDRLLNESTYASLGGVTGSLGRRLQGLYDFQDDFGKDQFRWMMLKLVTYEGSDIDSSVVSRLAPKAEFSGKQAELLDQLITQGFVVSSGTSNPSVQLGHEKIIDAWPEFTKWTNKSREANTVRQQLSTAANEWTVLLAANEKQKATRALWQGSQLEKARELRQRGDFEQLGGLNVNDNRFLDASHRRNQRLIRSLQWAITIAALLGAFGWWSYGEVGSKNTALVAQTEVANKKSKEAEENAREANRQSANAFWRIGVIARDQNRGIKTGFNFLQAAQACMQAGEADDRIQQRNIELAAQFATSSLIRTFPHDAAFSGAQMSGDDSQVLTWSYDGTLRLWDVAKAEPVQLWKHDSWVKGAIFSHDESRVVAWSDDGAVKLWDVTKDEPLRVWKHDNSVKGAVFTRDDSRVLAWSGSFSTAGKMELCDVTKDEPLRVWKYNSSVKGAVFTQDDSRVLAWSDDGAVKLLDVTKDEPLRVWKHDDSVKGAVYTRDDSCVLAWSDDGAVKLWDVTKDEPLRVWKHDGPVKGAVFSCDDTRVLAWSGDGVVKLWDVAKAAPQQVWKHESSIGGVAFTHAQHSVLAWSDDGEMKLWNVTKAEPLQVWEHDRSIDGAAFTRNDSCVLTWGSDGAVTLWDVTKVEPLQVWKHDSSIIGAVFSQENSRVLLWSRDGAVKLWDVAKATPQQVWKHESSIGGVAFTHAQHSVLAWSDDGEMKLWDVTKAEPLQVWKHDRSIDGAAFTRDDSCVLTWGSDGAVTLWDVTKVEPLQVWKHDSSIIGAVFSQENSRVLSWSRDGEIKLWEVTKAEPLQEWRHDWSIEGVVFTRDDTRVLSWGSEGAVKLWDVSKVEPLQVWKHEWCNGAMLARNDSRVLTWGGDGNLMLWDVMKAEPVQVWRHNWPVEEAAYTRDESRILTWSGRIGVAGEVRLWDVTKAEPLQVWKHDNAVESAVFTRDESNVLSWSADGEIKLWGVTKGEPLQVWSHDGAVDIAMFARDDSQVLARSNDGMMKLWDVTKAEPLQVWKNEWCTGMTFTDDDSRLLTGGINGAVKLWDVTRAEPLQVWKHSNTIRGAAFMNNESRVLAWTADGEVALLDSGLKNPELSPTERAAELRVRSASRLDSAGQLVPLKSAEWISLVRSPEYAAIQRKLRAAENSSPPN